MCLRLGFISSSLILSTIIAVIRPVVNIQNNMFISNLKKLEVRVATLEKTLARKEMALRIASLLSVMGSPKQMQWGL